MQECEVILLKEPNAPEILAMLGDIETRLQAAGQSIVRRAVPKNGLIASPQAQRRSAPGDGGLDGSAMHGTDSTRVCRIAGTISSRNFW